MQGRYYYRADLTTDSGIYFREFQKLEDWEGPMTREEVFCQVLLLIDGKEWKIDKEWVMGLKDRIFEREVAFDKFRERMEQGVNNG